MERITTGHVAHADAWDTFHCTYISADRSKDYRFLARVFDLSLFEGTLLDAGCGMGKGLQVLGRQCTNVTEFYGFDISKVAIEKAKQRNEKASLFVHDIQEPIEGTFDNIVCLQTIEHVEDPKKAFHNLLTATKSVLIISVPRLDRRKARTHLWSFDSFDFEATKTLVGDDNIYWLIDKQSKGVSFKPAFMEKSDGTRG